MSMIQLDLQLLAATDIKRKKPWKSCGWIGQSNESLILVDKGRCSILFVKDGTTKRRIPAIDGYVRHSRILTLSRNGLYLCGVTTGGEVFLWNKDTAKLITIESGTGLDLSDIKKKPSSRWILQVSDNGKQIMVVVGYSHVYLWHALAGEPHAEAASKHWKSQGTWQCVQLEDVPGNEVHEAGQHQTLTAHKEVSAACSFYLDCASGEGVAFGRVYSNIQEPGRMQVCASMMLTTWSHAGHILPGSSAHADELLWHIAANDITPSFQVMASKGAYVSRFSRGCHLLAVAANQVKACDTSVLFISPRAGATVITNLKSLGFASSKQGCDYWVCDMQWTLDDLFLAVITRRGSVALLSRAGPVVAIGVHGCDVDLVPALSQPLLPPSRMTEQENVRPPSCEGRGSESPTSSTLSGSTAAGNGGQWQPAVGTRSHQRYSLCTHPRLPLIAACDGHRVIVMQLPSNLSTSSVAMAMLQHATLSAKNELPTTSLSRSLPMPEKQSKPGSHGNVAAPLLDLNNPYDSYEFEKAESSLLSRVVYAIKGSLQNAPRSRSLRGHDRSLSVPSLSSRPLAERQRATSTAAAAAAASLPPRDRSAMALAVEHISAAWSLLCSEHATHWGPSLECTAAHAAALTSELIAAQAMKMNQPSKMRADSHQPFVDAARTCVRLLGTAMLDSSGWHLLPAFLLLLKSVVRQMLRDECADLPKPARMRVRLVRAHLVLGLLRNSEIVLNRAYAMLPVSSCDSGALPGQSWQSAGRHTVEALRMTADSAAAASHADTEAKSWRGSNEGLPYAGNIQNRENAGETTLCRTSLPSVRLRCLWRELMRHLGQLYCKIKRKKSHQRDIRSVHAAIAYIVIHMRSIYSPTAAASRIRLTSETVSGLMQYLEGMHAESVIRGRSLILRDLQYSSATTVPHAAHSIRTSMYVLHAALFTCLQRGELLSALDFVQTLCKEALHNECDVQRHGLTPTLKYMGGTAASMVVLVVLRSLARFMVMYFTNESDACLFLPAPHAAIPLPGIFDTWCKDATTVPIDRQKISEALRSQGVGHVWTADTTLHILLASGLFAEAVWFCWQMGDWKMGLFLSLACDQYKKKLSLMAAKEQRSVSSWPQSTELQPNAVVSILMHQLLPIKRSGSSGSNGLPGHGDLLTANVVDPILMDDTASMDQAVSTLREVLLPAAVCSASVVGDLLGHIVEELMPLACQLSPLVPEEIYLPAPPLFCPQPGVSEAKDVVSQASSPLGDHVTDEAVDVFGGPGGAEREYATRRSASRLVMLFSILLRASRSELLASASLLGIVSEVHEAAPLLGYMTCPQLTPQLERLLGADPNRHCTLTAELIHDHEDDRYKMQVALRELLAVLWMFHVRDNLTSALRKAQALQRKCWQQMPAKKSKTFLKQWRSQVKVSLFWCVRLLPFGQFLGCKTLLREMVISLIREQPAEAWLADVLAECMWDVDDSAPEIHEKLNSLLSDWQHNQRDMAMDARSSAGDAEDSSEATGFSSPKMYYFEKCKSEERSHMRRMSLPNYLFESDLFSKVALHGDLHAAHGQNGGCVVRPFEFDPEYITFLDMVLPVLCNVQPDDISSSSTNLIPLLPCYSDRLMQALAPERGNRSHQSDTTIGQEWYANNEVLPSVKTPSRMASTGIGSELMSGAAFSKRSARTPSRSGMVGLYGLRKRSDQSLSTAADTQQAETAASSPTLASDRARLTIIEELLQQHIQFQLGNINTAACDELLRLLPWLHRWASSSTRAAQHRALLQSAALASKPAVKLHASVTAVLAAFAMEAARGTRKLPPEESSGGGRISKRPEDRSSGPAQPGAQPARSVGGTVQSGGSKREANSIQQRKAPRSSLGRQPAAVELPAGIQVVSSTHLDTEQKGNEPQHHFKDSSATASAKSIDEDGHLARRRSVNADASDSEADSETDVMRSDVVQSQSAVATHIRSVSSSLVSVSSASDKSIEKSLDIDDDDEEEDDDANAVVAELMKGIVTLPMVTMSDMSDGTLTDSHTGTGLVRSSALTNALQTDTNLSTESQFLRSGSAATTLWSSVSLPNMSSATSTGVTLDERGAGTLVEIKPAAEAVLQRPLTSTTQEIKVQLDQPGESTGPYEIGTTVANVAAVETRAKLSANNHQAISVTASRHKAPLQSSAVQVAVDKLAAIATSDEGYRLTDVEKATETKLQDLFRQEVMRIVEMQQQNLIVVVEALAKSSTATAAYSYGASRDAGAAAAAATIAAQATAEPASKGIRFMPHGSLRDIDEREADDRMTMSELCGPDAAYRGDGVSTLSSVQTLTMRQGVQHPSSTGIDHPLRLPLLVRPDEAPTPHTAYRSAWLPARTASKLGPPLAPNAMGRQSACATDSAETRLQSGLPQAPCMPLLRLVDPAPLPAARSDGSLPALGDASVSGVMMADVHETQLQKQVRKDALTAAALANLVEKRSHRMAAGAHPPTSLAATSERLPLNLAAGAGDRGSAVLGDILLRLDSCPPPSMIGQSPSSDKQLQKQPLRSKREKRRLANASRLSKELISSDIASGFKITDGVKASADDGADGSGAKAVGKKEKGGTLATTKLRRTGAQLQVPSAQPPADEEGKEPEGRLALEAGYALTTGMMDSYLLKDMELGSAADTYAKLQYRASTEIHPIAITKHDIGVMTEIPADSVPAETHSKEVMVTLPAAQGNATTPTPGTAASEKRPEGSTVPAAGLVSSVLTASSWPAFGDALSQGVAGGILAPDIVLGLRFSNCRPDGPVADEEACVPRSFVSIVDIDAASIKGLLPGQPAALDARLSPFVSNEKEACRIPRAAQAYNDRDSRLSSDPLHRRATTPPTVGAETFASIQYAAAAGVAGGTSDLSTTSSPAQVAVRGATNAGEAEGRLHLGAGSAQTEGQTDLRYTDPLCSQLRSERPVRDLELDHVMPPIQLMLTDWRQGLSSDEKVGRALSLQQRARRAAAERLHAMSAQLAALQEVADSIRGDYADAQTLVKTAEVVTAVAHARAQQPSLASAAQGLLHDDERHARQRLPEQRAANGIGTAESAAAANDHPVGPRFTELSHPSKWHEREIVYKDAIKDELLADGTSSDGDLSVHAVGMPLAGGSAQLARTADQKNTSANLRKSVSWSEVLPTDEKRTVGDDLTTPESASDASTPTSIAADQSQGLATVYGVIDELVDEGLLNPSTIDLSATGSTYNESDKLESLSSVLHAAGHQSSVSTHSQQGMRTHPRQPATAATPKHSEWSARSSRNMSRSSILQSRPHYSLGVRSSMHDTGRVATTGALGQQKAAEQTATADEQQSNYVEKHAEDSEMGRAAKKLDKRTRVRLEMQRQFHDKRLIEAKQLMHAMLQEPAPVIRNEKKTAEKGGLLTAAAAATLPASASAALQHDDASVEASSTLSETLSTVEADVSGIGSGYADADRRLQKARMIKKLLDDVLTSRVPLGTTATRLNASRKPRTVSAEIKAQQRLYGTKRVPGSYVPYQRQSPRQAKAQGGRSNQLQKSSPALLGGTPRSLTLSPARTMKDVTRRGLTARAAPHKPLTYVQQLQQISAGSPRIAKRRMAYSQPPDVLMKYGSVQPARSAPMQQAMELDSPRLDAGGSRGSIGSSLLSSWSVSDEVQRILNEPDSTAVDYAKGYGRESTRSKSASAWSDSASSTGATNDYIDWDSVHRLIGDTGEDAATERTADSELSLEEV